MTPAPGAPSIIWAVYLGCTTASRLCGQWGIPKAEAAKRLGDAYRIGLIERTARGVYGAKDRR